MFRLLSLCTLSLLVLSAVSEPLMAQNQAPTKTLFVTLLTKTQQPMKIPGMENMPQMPGMPTGAPTWNVIGRAKYGEKPVEPLFVTVPTDLKLPDNKLMLHLPKPATTEGGPGRPGGQGETKNVEMVNKLYWHPDEAKGPVTESFKIKGGKMSGGGMPGMAMPNLDDIIIAQEGYEAEGNESKLPVNVKGQGNYVCNTGGTATLDGFLPPLQVTSPDMSKLTPEEGILVKWQPIAGARGYLISANGMNMDNADEDNMKMTTISWFSTLVQPPMRIRGGYQQETTIADDLANGILLPGNTTSCKIPGGIFNDVMMLMIRVEAIGNDFYSKADGKTVFGTIRSEWDGIGMMMKMGGEG
ncbi:MAG: hypothetical protein ABFE08_24485 [Armatimonadia bacterium]